MISPSLEPVLPFLLDNFAQISGDQVSIFLPINSRRLVFESRFSPAVDSPRRSIKKSHTPTGTHTAICG